MIDIENAKKQFLEYVKNYDINNGRINIKMRHILRVAENSKLIAQDLNLDDEKVKLAELIGIFHDIGRFEQVKLYNTFSDKASGLDHAEYSLKVLYEDGLIKKFLDTNKYDNIIKTAVYNHNKPQIASNISDEEMLFSKIIRDADKLDIFKVTNEDKFEDIFWYKEFENLTISPSVIEKFKKEHFLKYKELKNNAELTLVFYGYVYDFNFPICLKIIRDNKYLDKFYLRVVEKFKSEQVNRCIKEVLDMCNEYIDKTIYNKYE